VALRAAYSQPQVFSTGEVDTGRTWIDGKTIYRKVITSSGNISTDDASTQQIPLPYPSDSATTLIISFADDTNVAVNVGTFWTGAGNTLSDPIFILEYTKT
jgi:hypothetical protein